MNVHFEDDFLAAPRAPWPLVLAAALRFAFAAVRTPKTPTICTGLAIIIFELLRRRAT